MQTHMQYSYFNMLWGKGADFSHMKLQLSIIYQKQNTNLNILQLCLTLVHILTPFTPTKVTCLSTCSSKCNGALLTNKED